MKKQTILMTGGGTLGPVTPLLAIAQIWQDKEYDVDIQWIGTMRGPERVLIEKAGIPFQGAYVPKLSRHAWWTWILTPFLFLYSCVHAYRVLAKMRPNIIFSAGGFTSVPFVWIGRFMGMTTWIHQLDVEPGLANRLMSPFAHFITTTWESSSAFFPKKKTSVIGGMVRKDIYTGNGYQFLQERGLDTSKKTVLVLGGGTGAKEVNELLVTVGREIAEKANVIHVTGPGKMQQALQSMGDNYYAVEFLSTEMKDALDAATIVIARAGMGTIMELAALRKPTIFLPIADSHQEANAKALVEKGAAKMLVAPNAQLFKQEVLHLLNDKEGQEIMSNAMMTVLPMTAAETIAQQVMQGEKLH